MNQGDIKLDGNWYNIISYRDKDLSDFSPRSSTPSSASIYSNLQLYQNQSQTDWQHGFGDNWFTDEMKYMRTEGNIDTRHDGIVMMFTKATRSDTLNSAKRGFCNWGGAWWAWGDFGLRKYSGGTWLSLYSANAVNHALPMGEYLFFCPDGERIKKIDLYNVVTDTGNDSNSTDYKWLFPANGYIYAGKDETPNVHRDDSSDLSDLEGTTSDTNIIYIGASGSCATKGGVGYAGNLYVLKRDGMWVLGEDLIARRVLNFSNEESDDNFRSWSVFNGYLIFPIRDTIYQWNGARLSDVTPPRLSDDFPYTTYGRFDNFVAAGRYLFCTARTNESTYKEDLLCWDGTAWSKLLCLVSNGLDTISALGFDATNNYLWYHLNSTTRDYTYYIPFQQNSNFPYASFPTNGVHELILARWDMGYRIIKKSTPSILIEASNVSESSKLSVYTSIDGGDFVHWGDITTSGITKLESPNGLPTIEYNYIIVKIRFSTTDSSTSPVLEGIHLRFLMRPDTMYGWNITIPIAKNMDIGTTTENRMPKKIVEDLKVARNSYSPVGFTDIYGEDYLVYITSITTEKVEWDRDEGGNSPVVEEVAVLNLVEVT
jgi:hypothetical protein